MDREGNLRVWWIPQIPMKAFNVPVSSVSEAIKILTVLAEYDLFQYKNNVKPDYANAGGLNVFEDGEWCEWISPMTGADINEEMQEEMRRNPHSHPGKEGE